MALAVAGCGDGGDDAQRPASIERDAAGDVVDLQEAEKLLSDAAVGVDPATIARTLTDERPDLDLRAAGLDVVGRTLRLHVTTEAPIGTGTFVLTASLDEDCSDAQLTVSIRIDGDGEPIVEATDLPDGPAREIDAEVEVDRKELTLALPLLKAASIARWQLASIDAPPAEAELARYGDDLPDWSIERATFTRGMSRANDAGWAPCGPPDPALLAR